MHNCAIEKKIASCILVVVTSFCLSRAATVSFRQWTGNAGDNDIAKHKNFNSADLADENLAIGGFPAGRYTLRQITRYTLVETSGTVGDNAVLYVEGGTWANILANLTQNDLYRCTLAKEDKRLVLTVRPHFGTVISFR